jgi:hypothetical protein
MASPNFIRTHRRVHPSQVTGIEGARAVPLSEHRARVDRAT